MKNTRPIATTILIAIALCLQLQQALAHTAQAQARESPPALIARLLDQSGYTFTKAADGVWAVGFRGKAFSEFNVVVTSQQDLIVLFVIVAGKKEFNASPELMARLLKLNSDLDRVKIGIDEDGDAFVRIDLSARVLDLQEMKTNIEQAAAAADEAYGAIKPYLTAAK